MLNSCEVDVVLDRSEPAYEPGEEIAGRVRIEVDSECENNGVPVALEWYTHGRGNTESQVVASDRLTADTWQPGDVYEHEFAFEAPPGPVTYRGDYVNVDWRLTASADIPWAFDPEDAAELLVEPGPADSYTPGEEGGHRERVRSSEGSASTFFRFGFGLIFALAAFIPFSIALSGSMGAGSIWSFLFSIPFFGVGAWMIYTSVRNHFAELRLGDVEVELEPERAGRGGETRAAIAFTPESSVELDHVQFALKGRERAVSGSGTNKTTYKQPLHESLAIPPDSKGAQVSAGEGVRYESTFELPDTAPFTFHGDDNHVEWHVEYHVDIPGWPDWLHTAPLLVRPSGGEETGKKSDREARKEEPQEYAVEW